MVSAYERPMDSDRMKRMQPMKAQQSRTRTAARQGFTLVEILVVITILGILMAMMVPAAGLIIKRAKVSQAKSDAGVVVAIMMKYRAEYNRWPSFAKSQGTLRTDGDWVKAMSPKPGGGFDENNPKRIVFFQPGAGALDETTGAFVDPWGQPFVYMLDLDGDGQMDDPSGSAQKMGASILAWSAGPDQDETTFEDNPVSWK